MKVKFTASSNALLEQQKPLIQELYQVLTNMHMEVDESTSLYGEDNASAAPEKERAEELMNAFRDPQCDCIFDLSGGDLANECLPYLDMEQIRISKAVFWGYSDLTTILNALYTGAGKKSVLYQMRNLVRAEGSLQQERFQKWLNHEQGDLFTPRFRFLKGTSMTGTLVGGNLRCFMKLAGTPYFPDLTGKILFLEAWGGSLASIRTLMSQLQQMGAFEKLNGLLIGSFTHAESLVGREKIENTVYEIIREYDLPLASTTEVGHQPDSKALVIGGMYALKDETNIQEGSENRAGDKISIWKD